MFFDAFLSPLNPSFTTNIFDRFMNFGHERHSNRPINDIFETLNRQFDAAFSNVRSLHQVNRERMFNPSNHGRESIRNNTRARGQYGVTLNGDVVDRTQRNNRPFRHSSYDPVRLEPSRLQWYDSNTRRALLPQPPSTTQRTVSWLTVEELNKLPLSTYRTRQQAQATCSGDNSQDSPEHLGASSSSNGVNLTPTHVAESRSENGPGQSPSSYLVPFSRANNLVPIQPLISSPSSGSPECEVCLGEYRDRDRLRHLPCGHAFHADCIDKWFKQSTTCPKCRAGVKGGIKRLERARANNLLRLSSVGRPSHCERGCLHTLGRGNTSRQLTRPTVAAPVPVIRQERRQSSESRAAEVRRKAGEAAIQRAEAARLSETND